MFETTLNLDCRVANASRNDEINNLLFMVDRFSLLPAQRSSLELAPKTIVFKTMSGLDYLVAKTFHQNI